MLFFPTKRRGGNSTGDDCGMGLLYEVGALEGLPQKDAERIRIKIEWLWANRSHVRHFPLCANLSGYYKRRVGSFRIVYTYDENPDDMIIQRVGLRDDIYQSFP